MAFTTMSELCNHLTLANEHCENPVTPGSTRCAAGHRVHPSRWLTADEVATAQNFRASLAGSLELEDAVTANMMVLGGERQVRDIQELEAAGLQPAEIQPTVTLEVDIPDVLGNIRTSTIECYAIGEEFEINLAHGDLGKGPAWQFVTGCAEAGCNENAYVPMFNTFRWDISDPEEFQDSLEDAMSRSRWALCPEHRVVNGRTLPTR